MELGEENRHIPQCFGPARKLIGIFVSHLHANFQSTLTSSQVLKVGALSFFMVVFTLGLAIPWAVILYPKTILETTSYTGNLDLDSIKVHFDNTATSFSEGLGEAEEAIGQLGELFGV